MDDTNAELNISENQTFVVLQTLGRSLTPEDSTVAFVEE